MSSRIRSALSLCAATALAVGTAVLPGTAAAADETDAGGAAPTAPTPANVQQFLDERVPELLKKHNIPGAGVSVVANGQQVAAEGYGEADVDSGTPVEADTTAFPMASVSKSFTAVAALQLVEQGDLDLDANVNKYLPEDARVPATYPGKPITLHHLLTHTAGFEENALAMAAADPAYHLELQDYITEYQPERVYPPGQFVAYSNYGTSLVGLIVQEASGEEFSDYLTEHVFSPLGMETSAFAQPDAAAEMFDTPSLYDSTGVNKTPLLWVNQAPAGAGYATVTDMSRFMLALLNGGSYGGGRILSPESAQMVLSRQAGAHAELAGMGYGSMQKTGWAEPVIGHGGDGFGPHTQWVVAPESGFGVYVAVNADGTSESPLVDGRTAIFQAVLDEFVGTGGAAGKPEAADIPLDRYAGVYTVARANWSNVSEFATVQTQTTVTVADGRLTTTDVFFGETTWTPVKPNVFQAENGETLAFIEKNGEIIGLGYGALPASNFERISMLENVQVHLVVAGAALLVMLTFLAWPLAAAGRLVRGRAAVLGTGGSLTARILAAVAVAFCAGYVVFMGYQVKTGGLQLLMFHDSPLLVVQLVPAVMAGIGVLVSAVLAWTNKWWGAGGRIHYALVTLALIVFLALAAKYGMIGVPAE